ncbi:hypothetical protein T4D_10273 [Trichinella pseudospiralis]|uniref:Uncharacterized protein n=1 Tax=Trichinella pseudospiralis TaxID=6337 RepID=A0A0V1FXS8_TRIPS|nr:hypothetical protein T4D_10273 [Trichinella pseudospiralis]
MMRFGCLSKVSITVVTISDTLHHLFAIKMSAVTCYLSICIIKPLRYSYIEADYLISSNTKTY